MLTNQLFSLDPSSRIKIDLYATDSPKECGEKIYDAISDNVFMLRMQQLAWEAFSEAHLTKNSYDKSCMENHISSLLVDTGIKAAVVSSTVRIYENSKSQNMKYSPLCPFPCTARHSTDELLDHIREARMNWEKGIKEELLAIAGEMNRKFAICRPDGTSNPLLDGNIPAQSRENVRFLFDSEDLYETCVNLRSPNLSHRFQDTDLGSIKVKVPVSTLAEVSNTFAELSCPRYTHFGLDESNPLGGTKFSMSRHEMALVLLNGGPNCGPADAYQVREFLKRGAPPGLRSSLWRVAFGFPAQTSTGIMSCTTSGSNTGSATNNPSIERCGYGGSSAAVTNSEVETFTKLRDASHKLDLLTDELYIHDVCNVTDDLRYFVFEDELKESMLCFSRDETVRRTCEYEIHKPLLGLACAEQEKNVSAPPNAVQPFLGLAAYFAPLCYVFVRCYGSDDTNVASATRSSAGLYSMVQQTYCRLWCKMNVISSDKNTLLHVAATFETLLMTSDPKLFMHMLSIGIKPLHVALPWMQLGFVGLLEVEQVLILWDRLFGYMNTTILAVFAAAIFVFRSHPLQQCVTAAEAQSILNEGLGLRVVPLLQMFLLNDSSSFLSCTTQAVDTAQNLLQPLPPTQALVTPDLDDNCGEAAVASSAAEEDDDGQSLCNQFPTSNSMAED